MGKKKKAEMDLQRARFLSGAAEKGLTEAMATLLFDRMEKFAGYGFNKSHAMPYALIAYQTAWLKANAPVEFFAGSMSLDLANTDKLSVFYQDAKRCGVKIRSPDVNLSGADLWRDPLPGTGDADRPGAGRLYAGRRRSAAAGDGQEIARGNGAPA